MTFGLSSLTRDMALRINKTNIIHGINSKGNSILNWAVSEFSIIIMGSTGKLFFAVGIEVGLGAVVNSFHQKQQTVGSSLGISLSGEKKMGVKAVQSPLPNPAKSENIMHQV